MSDLFSKITNQMRETDDECDSTDDDLDDPEFRESFNRVYVLLRNVHGMNMCTANAFVDRYEKEISSNDHFVRKVIEVINYVNNNTVDFGSFVDDKNALNDFLDVFFSSAALS